jgi:hypothetical protein
MNAEKALDKVIKSVEQELSVEDMIKQTLKVL